MPLFGKPNLKDSVKTVTKEEFFEFVTAVVVLHPDWMEDLFTSVQTAFMKSLQDGGLGDILKQLGNL